MKYFIVGSTARTAVDLAGVHRKAKRAQKDDTRKLAVFGILEA